MKIIPLSREQGTRCREWGTLCPILCAVVIFSSLLLAESTAAEDTPAPDTTQQSPTPVAQTAEGDTQTQPDATIEKPAGAPQPPDDEMYTTDLFSNYISLYADHRARRVGDIVTIIITESSKASKSSATQTSKKSGTNGSLSEFFGLGGTPVKMGVDAGSDYSGSGTTTRSGSMEARISASVTQVMPNGTLVLEGTRQVTVNDDVQIITVSGIVRPQDVRADNSVLSMHMADARIGYIGEGPIAQRPGIVTRILQTPFHWIAGVFRKIF